MNRQHEAIDAKINLRYIYTDTNAKNSKDNLFA